jgi:hypothetical protein
MGEKNMPNIIQVSDRELKLEDVQYMVGEGFESGLIEFVYPTNSTPAMMGIDDDAQYIVNEEGLLKGLKVNPIGSEIVGQPIVGNLVILTGKAKLD